jgi:hypothetical protein
MRKARAIPKSSATLANHVSSPATTPHGGLFGSISEGGAGVLATGHGPKTKFVSAGFSTVGAGSFDVLTMRTSVREREGKGKSKKVKGKGEDENCFFANSVLIKCGFPPLPFPFTLCPLP